MDEAKMTWRLSNGEVVAIGDRVFIDEGEETHYATVIDIGETYITGELDEGGEIDVYFSELKDVKVIEQS